MITGDQRATAEAVGRAVGVIDGPARIVEGRELEAMTAPQLAARISGVHAFSRVSPEHKLLIVEALQHRGEIVAMLGDGVNDAAALKKADVGVAMGVRGTDVAKQAAAIVLQDDRFETVAAAVEEGRVIFDNIRKFVFYLFSCNVAEILVLLVAGLAGLPLPLTPLQLLWLNMVTDTFPALALAMEPGDATVMRRPPRDPQEAILSPAFLTAIFVVRGHDYRRHAGGVLVGAAARAGSRRDHRLHDAGARADCAPGQRAQRSPRPGTTPCRGQWVCDSRARRGARAAAAHHHDAPGADSRRRPARDRRLVAGGRIGGAARGRRAAGEDLAPVVAARILKRCEHARHPGSDRHQTSALQGDHHVPPAKPLRVLVVDGELLIRWSLAAALEEHGHHVAVAADRDAALHALQTEPLDVILLDCHLADATDLELLRIVRRRAPETPVVGMTAFPSRELTRRAGSCGVARLLEKPFDVFEIERVLLDECAKAAADRTAKSSSPP